MAIFTFAFAGVGMLFRALVLRSAVREAERLARELPESIDDARPRNDRSIRDNPEFGRGLMTLSTRTGLGFLAISAALALADNLR